MTHASQHCMKWLLVLETPHRNTECQLQGCRDPRSIPHPLPFSSPPSKELDRKVFLGQKKSGTFTRNQQSLEEQSFLTGRMGTFTPPQHHRDRDREESGPSWTRPTTPGHLDGGASAQLGLFKVHPKVNGCTRAKVSAGALQLRPVLIGRVQNLLLAPGRRFPVLVLLGEDGKQKGWGGFRASRHP